jgi:hypothetical protein
MSEKRSTGRNKLFIVSLILFVLISTLVAVSHHHENTDDDHDCPICIVINHQSAAGPSADFIDGIPFLAETTVVASAPALPDTSFFFSHSTRGPPA